jgi:hypothetical protein
MALTKDSLTVLNEMVFKNKLSAALLWLPRFNKIKSFKFKYGKVVLNVSITVTDVN